MITAASAGPAAACDASRRAAANGPRSGRAPLIVGDSTMTYAAPYRKTAQAEHGFGVTTSGSGIGSGRPATLQSA